ncbi:MAG: hypothetical protein U9N51_11385 [Bacteroidota bacterium]|nr:hypothetical protein [Bacteroidota bacterium]
MKKIRTTDFDGFNTDCDSELPICYTLLRLSVLNPHRHYTRTFDFKMA